MTVRGLLLKSRLGALALVMAACAVGCGTTRWTDTQRTATEQLLVTDAIDRAVSQVNLRSLAGHTVFLDVQFLQRPVLFFRQLGEGAGEVVAAAVLFWEGADP